MNAAPCRCFTTSPLLGLCLGGYDQLIRDLRRRSSIFQQPARDRVATASKPEAASRLWCAVHVKQRKKVNVFKNLIGSLGHHQTVTHCWHHGTRHICKLHNQQFIMRRAIWRHVFRHPYSHAHAHAHARTHARTHTHTHTHN